MILPISKPLIIAVGTVAIVGSAYWIGRDHGKASAARDAVNAIIKENKDWNNAVTDADRLNAFDACIRIGGVHHNCADLLRLEAPAEGQ